MANWRWLEQITDHALRLRLEVLAKVPLFTGLSRRQLGRLLVKFFEKEYQQGEMIFLEGEPGKALFIVLSGQISICRALPQGDEEVLANLGAGAYFGELALIDDQPRFAGARAVEPSLLLILYRSDFEHLIEGHRALAIQVMSNLMKTLAGYVRKAQSQANDGNNATAGSTAAPDSLRVPRKVLP